MFFFNCNDAMCTFSHTQYQGFYFHCSDHAVVIILYSLHMEVVNAKCLEELRHCCSLYVIIAGLSDLLMH